MSEAKHTLGPWKADGNDVMAGRFRVVHGCTAGGASKGMADRWEIEQANARLIAAAPELLKALTELLADSGWSNMTDSDLAQENLEGNAKAATIAQARAAIAKATGAAQ